jgi:hypothetical protein
MTDETAMTLEQVRDWHRKMSLAHGYWSAQRAHEKMADAIDSALKAQGEPVYQCLLRGDHPCWADRDAEWYERNANDEHPFEARILYTAPPTDDRPTWDPEYCARIFHSEYERLAPKFGYDTRPETKLFDPDSPNGKLMTAVCDSVLAEFRRDAEFLKRPA